MHKLTASVVGGGAGGKLSMDALEASDCFELKAVCDMKEEVCEQLKQRFPGIQTFTNYENMFAECPTDVVCISTFPPSHETVTLEALRYPLKGILVEKPIGHTADSGRRILEAVRKKGIPMTVPHGLLAIRASVEVIERVRQGDIGNLKLVEIQNCKWDIINAGIHWLNFFVNLVGNEAIDYVMAICESSTRTYRDGMQVETTAVTYGQTRSGIRVVMNTGDEVLVNREGKNALFRIVGDKGLIEYCAWEQSYYLVNPDNPNGTLVQPPEFSVARHQRLLEQMYDMIIEKSVDYRIPESAQAALEIVEAAYLSSRHQCKVTFPLDQFVLPTRNDWNPGLPYSGSGGGRNGRLL
jgi:predicted dehydrogenase